jgi:hypothetical protein
VCLVHSRLSLTFIPYRQYSTVLDGIFALGSIRVLASGILASYLALDDDSLVDNMGWKKCLRASLNIVGLRPIPQTEPIAVVAVVKLCWMGLR